MAFLDCAAAVLCYWFIKVGNLLKCCADRMEELK